MEQVQMYSKDVWFLLGVATVVALVIGGPLVTIWALNVLFGLSIEYSVQTWFAVVWLGSLLSGAIGVSYKKSK